MISAIKTLILGLVSCAFLFTACGKQQEAASFPDAPDAAVHAVIQGIAEGKGAVLWEAMPASYQADVNALAQLMGQKLDAEIYDQSFALFGRVGGVVQQQQDFIFTSEKLGNVQKLDSMKQAIPALMGFIELLAESSVGSVEGLKSFDGQSFFEATVSGLMQHAMVLSELAEGEDLSFGELSDAQIKVVSQDAAFAVLELSLPGQELEIVELVQVEGRWVPVDLRNDWEKAVAELKASAEGLTPESIALQKPQLMGLLTMLDGVVAQLEAAETQQQFDQALQGAMMPMFGLLMMGQQQMQNAKGASAPTAP